MKDCLAQCELIDPIKHLFDSCLDMHKSLGATHRLYRDHFRRVTANIRYYHSMIVDAIERLNKAGVCVVVDGKDRDQILQELRDLEERMPEWDYQNTCWNLLHEGHTRVKCSTTKFFLVLPSDLRTWDDSDHSTRQFRIYFMCDNRRRTSDQKESSQRLHLSNHPGYNLKRPQEFLNKYGDYILKVLIMVKRGYSNYQYEVPPLHTFKILWNCDPSIIGRHLTKDNLGPLVDKTIAYLQNLSPPPWKPKDGLRLDQSSTIGCYLDTNDDENTEGNLLRYVKGAQRVYWACQAHVHRTIDQVYLDELRAFVDGHGGHVDMQQATLKVELNSPIEADQFRKLLTSTKHTFDISIKLGWKATRSFAGGLFLDIAKTGILALEVDGVTLDIQPQDHVHCASNLFADIRKETELRFITLLNYPRSQEQCVHVGGFLLQSSSSIKSLCNMEELDSDLRRVGGRLFSKNTTSGFQEYATALGLALENHGVSGVTKVSIAVNSWMVGFDPGQRSVVDMYTMDFFSHPSIYSSKSLRNLTVDLHDRDSEQQLLRLVESNTDLQELNVSYYRGNVLECSESVVKMCHDSSRSLRLTLLDRMIDTQGRIIAQLDIQRRNDDNCAHGGSACNLDVDFLLWECDHVFFPLSDFSISLLSTAAQHHPLVLAFFTLDITSLSAIGFASVDNFLSQSSLEHLRILCSPFDLVLSDHITKVLQNIPWSTLKTLDLTGDNIDQWVQLWPPTDVPRLLSLTIQGTSSEPQELSHPSALFIHRLIYVSPLVELIFKNVQMQDKNDWQLISETFGPVVAER